METGIEDLIKFIELTTFITSTGLILLGGARIAGISLQERYKTLENLKDLYKKGELTEKPNFINAYRIQKKYLKE